MIPCFPWIALPALHPVTLQEKEGIEFCHLATLPSLPACRTHSLSLSGRGPRSGVCSVCSVDCCTNSNGAYVNFVSLEPTFEPSIRPLSIVAVVAGREEEGKRRREVRNGEWPRGGRRRWFSGMSSVLCWVGARGFYTMLAYSFLPILLFHQAYGLELNNQRSIEVANPRDRR